MLDFPDDELPQSVPVDILARMDSAGSAVQSLLDTWQEGHVLREGARIVIAGAPNVGKSTLLNLLAGRDRAIVSPHPGTTRDTIEEAISLRGYPLHLVDTAGLRDAPCEIEREGIRRTRHALAHADLCICVVDASQPLSADERAFLSSQPARRTLVLLNKSDLGRQIRPECLPDCDCLPISLKNNPDLTILTDKILLKIVRNPSSGSDGAFAISGRHKKSLLIALDELKKSENLVSGGLEADFLPAATHLRAALESIGHVFGKNCSEEMLNAIFSRFCVGK